MFHSVYKQRAFKENIIGVPRKTRELICWGTFLDLLIQYVA